LIIIISERYYTLPNIASWYYEPKTEGRNRGRNSCRQRSVFSHRIREWKMHYRCNKYELNAGDAIVIPAGAKHNVINIDNAAALKMYTIYSPAHHKDGITRATKKEAETNAEEFDGVTTEKSTPFNITRES
jgi:hypothetical protein